MHFANDHLTYMKRHIIALFTDAPSHELGFGKKDPSYPKHGMLRFYYLFFRKLCRTSKCFFIH